MNKKAIYFDNAATTRTDPVVIDKMLKYLKDDFGNASSVHSFGRKARVAVEDAREIIAEFIGAKPKEIFFVSGGTEADNFLLRSISSSVKAECGRTKILSDQTEHPAVLETLKELQESGFDTRLAESDGTGVIQPLSISGLIDDEVSLVSVMHVNNETGAVNDIGSICEAAHRAGALFHSDAVQSFGKLPLDAKLLNADAMSFSAHKINGPKGIGAVYIKSGTPVEPLIRGGSQERNMRGGTENVAAIAGFGEAVRLASKNMSARYNSLKSKKQALIRGIKSVDEKGLRVNGEDTFSPYILSLTFLPEFYSTSPDTLLMQFDINGIAVSNGSACSSGSVHVSHVLRAMGMSVPEIKGTIRISLGKYNTNEDIKYFLETLKSISRKFKKS